MKKKIKKILNEIKMDFLGILGESTILWIISFPFFIFIALFLFLGISCIPRVGSILALFALYLSTCFWGAYLVIGKVSSKFNDSLQLRELAKRWDDLSGDEMKKIEETITKTLDENRKRLIKIMGEDKFYHKYEEDNNYLFPN